MCVLIVEDAPYLPAETIRNGSRLVAVGADDYLAQLQRSKNDSVISATLARGRRFAGMERTADRTPASRPKGSMHMRRRGL